MGFWQCRKFRGPPHRKYEVSLQFRPSEANFAWWSVVNNIPYDGSIPHYEELFILEARLGGARNRVCKLL